MMASGMQDDYKLVVTEIIDRAARHYGNTKVISRDTIDPAKVHTSTFKDIHRRSQLAALAFSRIGIQPGERIATLAWNTTRHLESWYGIAGVGAVCHTLNPRLFESDLVWIINDAEDSVIMTDPCFLPLISTLLPQCPSIQHVILFCSNQEMPEMDPKTVQIQINVELYCFDDMLEMGLPYLDNFKWAEIDENQACGLCYTSGTTGNPKGVLYSHRSNFLHSLASCMPDALNISCNDTLLLVVPLFHANGWGLGFSALYTGCSVVLPAQYLTGDSVHTMINQYKVTMSAAVPTVWQYLYLHLKQHGGTLATLKWVGIGGSATPRHLVEYFGTEHNVEVMHLWGMTETSPFGSACVVPDRLAETLTADQLLRLKIKQGKAAPLVDMKIVNSDTGIELPWDGKTSGDLYVRGPFVLRRYYKKEKDAADGDGWFLTGDVATIDSNGYMEIVDRSKDVIKSGGEWISSIEIENKVMGHPGVAEAAVIAKKDDKWGERPLLVVVRNEAATADGETGVVSKEEILGYLEGKVVKWWIPDAVVFVKEIPHTATGKISKKTLREELLSGGGDVFHPC